MIRSPEEALKAMSELMQLVHDHSTPGSEICFDHVIAMGGADSLVYWLQTAVKQREFLRQRGERRMGKDSDARSPTEPHP